MTKNVSLSFVVCFPRKRSLTERKSPLLGAQTVSLPFSVRLLETTTHTTPSRTPLSLSLSLAPEIIVLLFLVPRERKGDVFFPSLGCSLWADLFPVHFLPFQKSCIRSCTRCSLTLSRTHTHTNSAKSMRRWYATAFLCAHSSERVVVRAKKEEERAFVLIFVWNYTRIDDLRKKEGETAAREKRTKRNFESNLFQRREKLSRAKEEKLPKTVREELHS